MAFIKTRNIENTYNKNTIEDIYKDATRLGVEINPFDILEYITNIPEIKYWEDYFDDDISGKIEYDKNTGIYQIMINKYHSLARRRFTLAHEFAHFVLHKEFLKKNKTIEDRILFRKGDDFNQIETQANQFAADLLMPKDIFIDELKKGNTRIESLANFFHVSYSAIKYRAFKLGYLKEY